MPQVQTQDINIGNLRIAIFNYILSKQLNEDLVVRIDDTDREKNIEGKDKEILEILNLFSIEYKKCPSSKWFIKISSKISNAINDSKKHFLVL